MKIFIGIFIFCVGSFVVASVIPSGVLMCNNPSDIRKLVELDRQGKSGEFLNFYSEMESRGRCTTSAATMNPDRLGRVDLSGGVTQIGNLYFATRDIK